jgi:hypothetical protein
MARRKPARSLDGGRRTRAETLSMSSVMRDRSQRWTLTTTGLLRSCPSRAPASLIGRICQAVELLLLMLSAVSGPSRCESRFSTQSARPGSTLHALVRRSGEPRLWTRLMRSGHLRLHPDHRSHPDALTSAFELLCSMGAHACVGAGPQRNSDPSIHMRCRITASLRATAMTARRWPRVLARRTPQAFNEDHCALRVSSECAAT